MKNLIVILAIVILSGCGLFRKVHKESTLDKVETSSKVSTENTAVTIDKSVTVTKEKADTIITVPAKTVRQETRLNMDSLVNGMTAVKNDLVNVRLVLNPVTGMLTTEATVNAQNIPVNIDRETTTQKDITKTEAGKQVSESKSKEEHKTGLVEREPKNTFWFVALGIGVVAVICFFVYLRFKK